jgi:hypothetical protein
MFRRKKKEAVVEEVKSTPVECTTTPTCKWTIGKHRIVIDEGASNSCVIMEADSLGRQFLYFDNKQHLQDFCRKVLNTLGEAKDG